MENGLDIAVHFLGPNATVPACSSVSLTIMLPHWNAMLQTQHRTPILVTIYRHLANLSLQCSLIWNITPEATTIVFMSSVRPDQETLPSSSTQKANVLLQCYYGCIQWKPQ